MSEVLKTRPRIDLFPGQNRMSPTELISHPEDAEHFEFLITDGVHLEHGDGLGCGVVLHGDQIGIQGKLFYGGRKSGVFLLRAVFYH
jgi:hypothetical protein